MMFAISGAAGNYDETVSEATEITIALTLLTDRPLGD